MRRIALATGIFTLPLLATASDSREINSIGYPTVTAAYDALKLNPHASLKVEDGWIIGQVQDKDAMELWSFTPAQHVAYPAVIKREVIEKAVKYLFIPLHFAKLKRNLAMNLLNNSMNSIRKS